MEKLTAKQKYSDEDCVNMIKNMTYPQDAPSFVIKMIRARRRDMERKIVRPEKELDAAMKELGGFPKCDK
jgi:hypothetical protein